MAVLARVAAASVVASYGCYGPEWRECAVACESQLDCAPEQVCGSDGRCASPSRAGRCTGADAPDGGVAPVDASPSPLTTTLRIKLRGRGHVIVNGNLAMICDHTAPGDQCTFEVLVGVVHTLHAFAANGHVFERWGEACSGEQPACWITPTPPKVTVSARFDDDDD